MIYLDDKLAKVRSAIETVVNGLKDKRMLKRASIGDILELVASKTLGKMR
jgi:hypothetical protein